MFAAVIFSNDYWTFWDVMLFCFIWIPLVMLWFFCMFDVFGRRDVSGWGKAAWILAIAFLPWVGSIAYLITRPKGEGTYARSYGASPADYQQEVVTETREKVPTGK